MELPNRMLKVMKEINSLLEEERTELMAKVDDICESVSDCEEYGVDYYGLTSLKYLNFTKAKLAVNLYLEDKRLEKKFKNRVPVY